MYDALARMYEGRNIKRKMNLRAQLKGNQHEQRRINSRLLHKGIPVQRTTMCHWRHPYEDELVMIALNGLTRPWDSFI